LVSVSGATTASFVYNGDGERVKGSVNGVTTAYVGNYVEWNGSALVKYYYAGGQRVAMRGSGVVRLLLGDHLGSTTITATDTGTLYSELRYKAWGGERYSSATETPTTFRFTGQRADSYINMYWFGSRWYDPYLAHFVQADSIIPDQNDPQSWDRFAYAFNNPVKYSDPSGHCPWCIVGAVVGAAVGYGVQVYNNYQNGYTGSEAWTQNISAEPIIAGALIGAGAVIFAPAAAAAAGDLLMGAGLLAGGAEGAAIGVGLGTAGVAASQVSQSLSNVIYPVSYPTLEFDSQQFPNIAPHI
ncbi:MAG: hypothetical protein A2Z49_10300, partial [Chloroflexi bacterium RBG_19FT_COMBO_56_12]